MSPEGAFTFLGGYLLKQKLASDLRTLERRGAWQRGLQAVREQRRLERAGQDFASKLASGMSKGEKQ